LKFDERVRSQREGRGEWAQQVPALDKFRLSMDGNRECKFGKSRIRSQKNDRSCKDQGTVYSRKGGKGVFSFSVLGPKEGEKDT